PTMISTKAWNLPGTPAVARRAQRMKETTNSRPSTKVKNRVSTFKVMNAPSPTLTCRWCRWWLMYSVDPPVAGSVAAMDSVLGFNAAASCFSCHAKPGGRPAFPPPARPVSAARAIRRPPARPQVPPPQPTTCPAFPASDARTPRLPAGSRRPAPPPPPAHCRPAWRCRLPPPPGPIPGPPTAESPPRPTAPRWPGRLPRAVQRGDPWRWDRARATRSVGGDWHGGQQNSPAKPQNYSRRACSAATGKRHSRPTRSEWRAAPVRAGFGETLRPGRGPSRQACGFLVESPGPRSPGHQAGALPFGAQRLFPRDVEVGDGAFEHLGGHA